MSSGYSSASRVISDLEKTMAVALAVLMPVGWVKVSPASMPRSW